MLPQVINVLYYKCWQFDRFKTISDAITVPKATRFQVIFQLFRNIILLQLFLFFFLDKSFDQETIIISFGNLNNLNTCIHVILQVTLLHMH